MRRSNFVRLNDWPIRKFIIVISAIQIAMVGTICLDSMGLNIPIFRQIIGFVYLTFIPGFVILRVLKIHNLSITKTLIYGIGLSIAFCMLIGLLINIILPLIGILKPISLWPIMITITIFVLALCITSYLRDKDYRPAHEEKLSLREFLSPPYLFLSLLPLLAVLGAIIATLYQNNLTLLTLILIICTIPIMVSFNKFIPKKAYVFALWMLTIALFLHITMVSLYPMRLNVDREYEFSTLVIQQGYWNMSLPYVTNSAVSITILAPIYNIILDISIIWIFKLIYPIIFSLLPLILYCIYDNQVGHKFAFLSVFFYLSLPYFYNFSAEAFLLRRQQIAIVYFALLILLLVDQKLPRIQKSILFLIFAFSLIIAHYMIGYVSLVIFSLAYLLERFWNLLKGGIRVKNAHKSVSKKTTFPVIFILFYLIYSVIWYIYSASGSPYSLVLKIWHTIINSSPSGQSSISKYTFGIGFSSTPLLGKIHRIFIYIIEFCMTIGIIKTIFRPNKFKKGYIILSVSSISLLVITIPFLSVITNTMRLYFILLSVLSPFCLVGGKTIWNFLSKLYQKGFLRYREITRKYFSNSPRQLFKPKSNTFLSFFVLFVIVPYYLFNVGAVFAIGGYTQEDITTTKIPVSPSLSYDRVDAGHYSVEEFILAKRLANVISPDSIVYADAFAGVELVSAWHKDKTKPFPQNLDIIKNTGYIFLRGWNINKNEICVIGKYGRGYERVVITAQYEEELFGKRNRVCDNGKSILYK